MQALKASWQALDNVLSRSLSTDGRIKGFKPDAASFLAYLFAHDAHHRGQIYLMLGIRGVATQPLYGLTSEEVRARST